MNVTTPAQFERRRRELGMAPKPRMTTYRNQRVYKPQKRQQWPLEHLIGWVAIAIIIACAGLAH